MSECITSGSKAGCGIDKWVEIYNPTSENISLSGFRLGFNNLTSKPINNTRGIAPKEFLVIYNSQIESGSMVSQFKGLNPSSGWLGSLDAVSDNVVLYDSSGIALDQKSYNVSKAAYNNPVQNNHLTQRRSVEFCSKSSFFEFSETEYKNFFNTDSQKTVYATPGFGKTCIPPLPVNDKPLVPSVNVETPSAVISTTVPNPAPVTSAITATAPAVSLVPESIPQIKTDTKENPIVRKTFKQPVVNTPVKKLEPAYVAKSAPNLKLNIKQTQSFKIPNLNFTTYKVSVFYNTTISTTSLGTIPDLEMNTVFVSHSRQQSLFINLLLLLAILARSGVSKKKLKTSFNLISMPQLKMA